MSFNRALLVVLWMICWQSVSLSFADTISVDFMATDEDGKPVAEVELSTHWIFDSSTNEGLRAVSDPTAFTDENGKATLEFDTKYREQFVLLGYSKDRRLGGLVVVESQDDQTQVEIEIRPTTSVTANYLCSETDSIPPWTNALVSINDVQGYFFEYRTKDGQVKFPLPSGKWNLRIYGSDIVGRREEIETTVAEPDLALGEIDFKATPMALLKGKPAPKLKLVDARGVPKDFQLADLKGKWVLIEFWGYW